MPMILNEFLHPLGKLKDLEIVSEELHNSLTNYQNDKCDYELELTNWTYNEIVLINGIRKLKDEIQNNIKTNYNVPDKIISQITSSRKTLDDVYEWIYEIDYESEWDLISDELLCELFIVFTQIHQSQLMKFYNDNLIVNLRINPNLLRRKLFVKLKNIDNQEDKLIFNEFFEYLKEFHSNNAVEEHTNPAIEEHFKKDESNKSELSKLIPQELDWHPFPTNEVRDFYLHIEKKHGTGNKTIFGAYWKFLSDNGIIDNKARQVKKRFVEWINLRFAFLDKEKINTLQTNSSEKFRENLLNDLVDYEELNGQFHNFLEDGNKKRQRKKPSPKN
jgi:hypothetical protein